MESWQAVLIWLWVMAGLALVIEIPLLVVIGFLSILPMSQLLLWLDNRAILKRVEKREQLLGKRIRNS